MARKINLKVGGGFWTTNQYHAVREDNTFLYKTHRTLCGRRVEANTQGDFEFTLQKDWLMKYGCKRCAEKLAKINEAKGE